MTRRWAIWPLRIAAVAETVLIFNQAVYAGRFLAGDFAALHTHRTNATVTGIVLIAEWLAAVLLRWPGRGPLWPALVTAGMFGLVALQILLGFQRALAFHVPLGVALIASTVLLLVWSWRHRTAS
jgi:hypothetical protein